MTESDVIGRKAELDAIDSFLEGLARGPAALAFEGHPGIGKTTVWRQGFARAAGRSFTTLSCRPVEAEAKLAFASLADLLEPIADEILPRLPEPQRSALEIALMRARPLETLPSARAVATAVVSTLRLRAETSPVVLAIDDQQWLDRASAESLAFALRRIGEHRVGVLATVRVEDNGVRDPLALDSAFAGRIARIRLGPLSLGELHHVIRTQLNQVFPRPTLRRIADTSGGNPFFAIELARAMVEADVHPVPGEPLPVPDTLRNLVARRLDRLLSRARATLLVASALSAPTVAVVRRAVGAADADNAIAQGERAGLIEVRGDHISFRHPLLASAVYGSAAAEMRRDVHRRLADVIAAPEERARHLALAVAQPDEDVARALDDAALLARQRGAPDAAGELQEQAARCTPYEDETARRRRRVQAAEHYFHAGARAHARALLDDVLADGPARLERVTALHLLGQIRAAEDSVADAIRYLEEALTQANDATASAPIRLDLAFAKNNAGDMEGALACSRAALAEAEQLGDGGLIACALSLVVACEFVLGHGLDRPSLERALGLEDRTRGGQLLLRPTAIAGLVSVYEGKIKEGEALLCEMCAWATERGEESGLPYLLIHLSWLEWWRGNFAAAAAYAEDALSLSIQTGSETMQALAVQHRSRARAACGDVAGARADLSEGRALIDKTGYVQSLPWLLSSQAALELSLGDAEAAAHTLEPLVTMVEAIGISEPIAAYFVADVVEAFIGVGQSPRAQALLDMFARRARELDRPWALAIAARSKSLLAAARGELDVAVAEAEDAVARCQQLDMSIEHGRALIGLGKIRRRRGERRAAREVLERARSLFHDLGAPLWAERADEELRRIPIRRAASKDELTPTEEQVAALAAAGRTNREVARELHMSPKTVEANLGRIYGKLGIRSRAELGARVVQRQATGEAKK